MKRILFFFLVAFRLMPAAAQPPAVPPGTELQELVRIMDVYGGISNLSFDMKITYADSLTWEDIIDSTMYECKISHGKTFLTNEEVETLYGREYYVYVDKVDSFVIATPIGAEQSIFQAPFLDSTFRANHVDYFSTYDIDDSTRVFLVFFKPESNFLTYYMIYDSNTGLIKVINFHARNEIEAYDIPSDHIVCATVYMENYSVAPLDPTIFNENRYIYRLNGSLYLQAAWDDFELMNQ